MDTKEIIFLLLLAALPVVVILLFIYLKDKNKEPLSLLIKLFLSGFISCVLVLLLSDMLEIFPFMRGSVGNKSFLNTMLYAFIGVALIEELCKWIMTYISGYHSKEFDEIYDGIVYCIFVSLGFAFIENIIYVIQTSSFNTALLRAVTAVPSHAFDAIFMGNYLGKAKQAQLRKDKEKEKKYLLYSVLVPTILHGIYDFCLMSGLEILMIIFIFFVVYLYIVSVYKVSKTSKNNKKIVFKNKFCGNCGRIVTGEFCPNCGQRQE